MDNITIRQAVPSDYAFVSTAWLKTYATSGHAKQLQNCPAAHYAWLLDSKTPANIYYGLHRKAIDACLGRPTTVVLAACSSHDPDTIAGFICGDPTHNVVHYVCVKPQYQNAGIALGLVKALGVKDPFYVSHVTEDWDNRFDQQDYIIDGTCFYRYGENK